DGEIVDQESDADAAFRRVDDVLHQQTTGSVVLPDEVLDIERLGGKVDEGDPDPQRIRIVVEQPEGGLALREAALDAVREARKRACSGRLGPQRNRGRRGSIE